MTAETFSKVLVKFVLSFGLYRKVFFFVKKHTDIKAHLVTLGFFYIKYRFRY